MFQGSMTALITPFKDGLFDEKSFAALLEFQIKNGTAAVVPCGTTGESATLTYEEHQTVIKMTVESVEGRVPVIAGAGSNSTEETIMLARDAESVGADALLLISPYYNRPSQNGIYQHYKKVAEAVALPILLYNVPGRTGINIQPETVARLSGIKNIVGIKEASGSLRQVSDIIELSSPGFSVISGDDFVTLPMLSIGAKGVISVTSNLVPEKMSDMFDAYLSGDINGAAAVHYHLQSLHRAMFLDTNPVPVKSALAMMGMVREEFRLPLTRMEKEKKEELKRILEGYDLVS